ncbi:cobyric acid synthase [Halalkalibacter akibai]|uniref:Cobyric acid synthase n=1 Tax=Halalkalibacter akibai (strain ATCC 43226 / DSM 21942 / CIP 109018 / JCM 9157 / 1139) TaxID=1236973 RepID=W4QVD8_HALA3|nr:cobyric acid synthase [Halalkalibacter akibai]GAE36110.1 cobyric acid synthase [Halalkalibacter akibai JCM 9157]
MKKAVPLMIQGTHSDAGKSALVTALCRIFVQDGFKTAPYKSQNMALNSYITMDGKEIGRAQGVQAEAARIAATTDMNPILIKPTSDSQSQIVVHGKPYKNMQAGAYRKEFYEQGLQLIEESYSSLASQYERIVIEGAGSPAEINLNDRELVNMRVAQIANSPVILVGDIEKGGVFASLVGTLQLLHPEDRKRVVGVFINKFRGDVTLLEPGLTWFEEYTGVPVLGVIPFIHDLMIEAEDSVVLSKYATNQDSSKEIDIAVIRYPMISNFTDIDPLFEEPDCHVRFVNKAEDLGNPDLVILPGSKNTIEDLMFIDNNGLSNRILQLAETGSTTIVGICGGYQMLGNTIEDQYGVESTHLKKSGLGLIPMKTSMTQTKLTVHSEGVAVLGERSIAVSGYEIHMGESIYEKEHNPFIYLVDREEGFISSNRKLIGTYFHGVFHNDRLREVLLNDIRQKKGLGPVLNRSSFAQKKEEGFDLLAKVVREHIQLDRIYEIMTRYQKNKN